jgi:hypothetical protein
MTSSNGSLVITTKQIHLSALLLPTVGIKLHYDGPQWQNIHISVLDNQSLNSKVEGKDIQTAK